MKKLPLNLFIYSPFLIVLIIAIYQRLQIPLVPYSIMDGYYTATVKFFQGIGLHCGNRLPPYPLIIFLIVYFTQSLSAIVYFQVISGVFSSLFLTYLFYQVTSISKAQLSWIRYVLTLLIFFTFTLSAPKIELEYFLRPEIVSQFFLILQIYFFYKIITSKKLNYYFGIFNFLTFFTPYFQDKFFGISILNIIIAFILIYRQKEKKVIYLMKYLCVPLAVFIPIYFSFQWFTSTKSNNPALDRGLWGYSSLFWLNQNSIIKTMNKDYNDPTFTRYSKDTLRLYLDFYQTIKGYYHDAFIDITSLDKINYQLSSIFNFQTYYQQGTNESLNFRKYYLFRSFINYPIDYLNRYYKQIKSLYFPYVSNVFLPNENIHYGIGYRDVEKNFITDTKNLDIAIPFISNYYHQIKSIPTSYYVVFPSRALNKLYFFFNFLYTPILTMFIITFLTEIKSKSYKDIGLIALYSALQGFLMLSFTSFIYLNFDRYTAEVYPALLFSLLTMIFYLLLKFKYAFFNH
ncbi:MAG TPA: hypothetical protein VN174_03530 [Candidatus Methanoperedens sp.]|nr:hypothetical protein [Candidatus Methanoperedens sp.]